MNTNNKLSFGFLGYFALDFICFMIIGACIGMFLTVLTLKFIPSTQDFSAVQLTWVLAFLTCVSVRIFGIHLWNSRGEESIDIPEPNDWHRIRQERSQRAWHWKM